MLITDSAARVRILVTFAPHFFSAPGLDEFPDIPPYMPPGGGPVDQKSRNFTIPQRNILAYM